MQHWAQSHTHASGKAKKRSRQPASTAFRALRTSPPQPDARPNPTDYDALVAINKNHPIANGIAAKSGPRTRRASWGGGVSMTSPLISRSLPISLCGEQTWCRVVSRTRTGAGRRGARAGRMSGPAMVQKADRANLGLCLDTYFPERGRRVGGSADGVGGARGSAGSRGSGSNNSGDEEGGDDLNNRDIDGEEDFFDDDDDAMLEAGREV
ncbi:hypothetical protein CIB48_g6182 [Xylaria polymorpha]|nr:hypothetical protein CIB48_g6182 [Xylaria polymorpha]